jgi:hypothetical protein
MFTFVPVTRTILGTICKILLVFLSRLYVLLGVIVQYLPLTSISNAKAHIYDP